VDCLRYHHGLAVKIYATDFWKKFERSFYEESEEIAGFGSGLHDSPGLLNTSANARYTGDHCGGSPDG
jgi:hypothetical protein